MQKNPFTLLLVALFLFSPMFAFGATNLIQNPTLQGTSPGPTGWLKASWGNASGAVFSFPAITNPKIDIGNVAQVKITNYGTSVGGGAAEWYFSPVAINGLAYDFSNEYMADVPTLLVAQYKVPQTTPDCTPSLEGGSYYCYFTLKSLPATSGAWVTNKATITAPADALAISVLHILTSNGTLNVGNYSLTQNTTSIFSQGMISLTFDDGWSSQYKNAFPILSNANMKGTFYVISNPMLQANASAENILCNNPSIDYCDGAVISSTQNSWTAAEQYPDPAERSYTFNQSYTANSTATLSVTYFNPNGATLSRITLATLQPSSTPKSISVNFQIPPYVNLTNGSYFSFTESVPLGKTLSVQNPSLSALTNEDTYMNLQQVKSMQSSGQEIGFHTADHCDLVMLEKNPNSAMLAGGPPSGACASPLSSPSTPTQQIQSAMQIFSSNGISANTMSYPYGSYDPNIKSLLKSNGIIASRSVLPGYNTKNTDPYALYNQIINQSVTNNGFTTVKNWIDTAIANKQWLVLTFHNVEPANLLTSNGDTDGTTPEFLQTIVNYLKSKNTPVVTVQQGMGLK